MSSFRPLQYSINSYNKVNKEPSRIRIFPVNLFQFGVVALLGGNSILEISSPEKCRVTYKPILSEEAPSTQMNREFLF